jgi:hypothetical protein
MIVETTSSTGYRFCRSALLTLTSFITARGEQIA